MVKLKIGSETGSGFHSLFLLVLAFLAFPALALAQGSGSSDTSKPTRNRKANNFLVTRSVSGRIDSLAGGRLVVKTDGGKSVALRVTDATRGRGCLREDNFVRVTFVSSDGRATVIRCGAAVPRS